MTDRTLEDLVEAAVSAARERGQDVGDVPVTVIAAAAGISRSTLLRRLGGSRAPLDQAVRDSGIDPGGRLPVTDRAVKAAAETISERGLGAVTLEAVAAAADCSLASLHASFDGRDGLLAAVFDRYNGVDDLETIMAKPPDSLEDTVNRIYRALVAMFTREPRVMPALFADLLARPDGPGAPIIETAAQRVLGAVMELIRPHIAAGRARPLPPPLLIQLMIGPLAMHLLLRPAVEPIAGDMLPSIEESCEVFADGFLRAITPGQI